MRTVITLMLVFGACAPSVSLDETVRCGGQAGSDTSCAAGQVCIEGRNLPDDGGIPAMCKEVSPLCIAHDCVGGDCPSCILELCPSYPSHIEGTRLTGRMLSCP